MPRDLGRFTLRGGPGVEAMVADMLTEVAQAFAQLLGPDELRALVLIGGYGRGEGGTELRGGVERPHNNLDFLLIARHPADPARLKARLEVVLEPIASRWGLGMDLGVVSDKTLERSPCLVMWHDMRFGHKTVLGDATYVPSLSHFTPEAIVPADIRNLLVNRGTLLVINQMLLERGALTADERRITIKHAMKAVIGYGDALLYSEGLYHWSYAEKQARMKTCQAAPEAFRRLYDEAMEFRFEPRYDALLRRDPADFAHGLLRVLEPIHLACEVKRLGMPWASWGSYHEAALRKALLDDLGSPRQVARKLVHLARFNPPRDGVGLVSHLGSRVSGMAGVLPLAFPVVAYGLTEEPYRTWAAALLGASGGDLRAAYLRHWGRHGDVNFGLFLQRLGLSVTDMRRQSA